MAKYLLIESRDPYEWNDVSYFYDLAHGLAREGHDVTLFLVQNGVLPARKSPRSGRLADLAQGGVKIAADDFSLRERGIAVEALAPGVRPSKIDAVVDLMGEGARALWH
ncbi:MAG TPA: DsrE family protein [Polyangia bacterium]|nr:DsrE family protein [Polyangia bacterium]